MTVDAVPLAVPIGDKINVGSGFFLAYSGREWLISAAHLPLMKETPHSRWNEWPDKVQILGKFSEKLSFKLRVGMSGSYYPAFAHLKFGVDSIADFMALCVPNGTANAFKARIFGFNLAPLAPGHKAEVVGYPASDKPWPQYKRFLVNVKNCDNELVYYNDPAPRGTSGGPLISSDGRLLGMSFGADDNVGKAVSNLAMKFIIDTVPVVGIAP